MPTVSLLGRFASVSPFSFYFALRRAGRGSLQAEVTDGLVPFSDASGPWAHSINDSMRWLYANPSCGHWHICGAGSPPLGSLAIVAFIRLLLALEYLARRASWLFRVACADTCFLESLMSPRVAGIHGCERWFLWQSSGKNCLLRIIRPLESRADQFREMQSGGNGWTRQWLCTGGDKIGKSLGLKLNDIIIFNLIEFNFLSVLRMDRINWNGGDGWEKDILL